ncbi:Sorting nexin-1 [Frankliniella fusca]|uniref:Sorting nexin-1 n=1 Tax=Frankliniella fusca TaxID=407009 RepID=A0AAE1GRB7_9NEOP|nr:Sorting nexin-1 [Frankliniella fusca]
MNVKINILWWAVVVALSQLAPTATAAAAALDKPRASTATAGVSAGAAGASAGPEGARPQGPLAPPAPPPAASSSSRATPAPASTTTNASAHAGGRGPGRASHCRTFYAHGSAGAAGADGLEYTTLLLWREHAVRAPPAAPGGADPGGPGGPGTRTLSVNVTGTEGARVMLGAAARALPGQPHYELVLGATANASRLLAHGAHHDHGASKTTSPSGASASASVSASNAPLFEEGVLQLWLSWTVTGHGANATGRLEVTALPAGGSAPLLLFNYTTTKPIQVETFSFGSTVPGDVAFRVCRHGGGGGQGHGQGSGGSGAGATDSKVADSHPQPGAPAGLGVPGCRSLLVHVQGDYSKVHNLAMDWAHMTHGHSHLQFWARAATDVEVLVSDRLHLKRGDPKYHVVYGGDFNTKSWAIGFENSARKAFRPLWLSVSSHGLLKAGSGDIRGKNKNHTDAAQDAITLLSWQHPRPPAPMFVTFATYRQRMVHILIDCAESPSLAPAPSYPSDMIEAVRSALASALASSLELNLERLSIHNGTLSASGTIQQELSHFTMQWHPHWFEEVKRIQFWIDDFDKSLQSGTATSITSLSEKAEFNLGAGTLEVNANRTILWKLPLHLQIPCKHNKENSSETCSLEFLIKSAAKDVKVTASKTAVHKWTLDWHILPHNGSFHLHLTASSRSQLENQLVAGTLSTPLIQQRHNNAWLKWISTFSLLASLVLIILANKELLYTRFQQSWLLKAVARSKKTTTSHWQRDTDDKTLIVGYDGRSASIIGTNTEQLQDSELCNELHLTQDKKCPLNVKQKGQEYITSNHRTQLTILTLITASLILSLVDVIIQFK